MKLDKFLRILTIAVCLLPFVSAAHAETRVIVLDKENQFASDVDSDSIRKDDESLVFHTKKGMRGNSDYATACQQRIAYPVITSAGEHPYWRSKGDLIVPDCVGARIAEFVC